MIPKIAGLLTFMADDNTTQTQTTTTETESTDKTQTAGGQQAGDSTTGADTQTAKTTTEAKTTDKTTTEAKIDTDSPEFKAALTAAIAAKMPHLHKQARKDVAKELSGEKEGEPTVEELKAKITGLESKVRISEARDQLESFVADKRNQIQVRNFRGLFKLIKDDLQYDDDGKVTNFKDVLAAAKAEAGEFFGGQSSSIDAGNGARQYAAADMNTLIRGR